MDRENIIRMAREAGWDLEWGGTTIEQVQSFAALVAAYIREIEFKPDWNNYRQGLVDGAAAEREACAALCEQGIGDWRLGKRVSAAIRARGGE